MKFFKSRILVISLLFCSILPAQNNNQTSSVDLFQQGLNAYQSGQYDLAITSLDRAIAYDANNALNYYYKGLSALHLKNYKQAYQSLNHAALIDASLKTQLMWLHGMGEAESGLKHYAESERWYREALKQKENKSESYFQMATHLYLEDGHNIMTAQLLIDSCLILDPSMSQHIIILAEKAEAAGDSKKALLLYEQVIKHAPTAKICFNTARLYYKNKTYPRACELYQQTIGLVGNNESIKSKCYLAMGLAYSHQEDYMEAINSFKQVIALEPNNINALLSLGNAFHQTEQDDKAKEMFERAVSLGSNDAQRWVNYLNELESEQKDHSSIVEKQK